MKRSIQFIFSFFILNASFLITKAQTLEKLGAAINTEYNEQHPLISPDGKTLYFIRFNHPSNKNGEKKSSDVWYADLREDGDWGISRRMSDIVNKDDYNDIFSITPDGNTLLINGAYANGKRLNEFGLSISKRTKTGWSEPQKLEIPKLNSLIGNGANQFLSGCLSNDGKTLILAFSEKKNSKEDDIYVSFLAKSTGWSKPELLSTDINTKDATETTPFLASDNYTLYFSSDRKGGLGGKDIWVSKRLDRTWGRWSKPVNMGEKINTDADELSYSIAASGDYAYMSTKKNSVGKGDIVRFKLRDNTTTTPVIAQNNDKDNKDNKTNADLNSTAPAPVVMLSGKVIDEKTGKPIEAKIIIETLPSGEEVAIGYTNPLTGEYKIVLPSGSRYSVRAEAANYLAISDNLDLVDLKEYKEIGGKDLKLVLNEVGAKVVLNNLFFETGKADLRSDSFPELDRVLAILKENAKLVIEIQGHTDNKGSFELNQKLSEDRAQSVRNYLVSKKLTPTRITSVGFGETKPIASNDTDEGRQKNRRVELVILKN